MRISDWSSDVCSSNLRPELVEWPLFLFAATNKNSASTSSAQTGSRWRCPALVFNPGMTRSTFAAIGAPIAPVPRLVHESFSPGAFIWFRQKVLPMARGRQLYQGKAKIHYEGPEQGTLIQYFKDATGRA